MDTGSPDKEKNISQNDELNEKLIQEYEENKSLKNNENYEENINNLEGKSEKSFKLITELNYEKSLSQDEDQEENIPIEKEENPIDEEKKQKKYRKNISEHDNYSEKNSSVNSKDKSNCSGNQADESSISSKKAKHGAIKSIMSQDDNNELSLESKKYSNQLKSKLIQYKFEDITLTDYQKRIRTNES